MANSLLKLISLFISKALTLKYLKILTLLNLFFIFQSQANQLNVVSEHWPPYIIQPSANSDKVSGIVTKRIRQILAYSPLSYEINIYPWARSYHLALTRPNTLIYSIYRTPEREPFFHWFCPLYPQTPVNIYKLKNNHSNIEDLNALKSGIVGVLRDDNSHKYMENMGFIEGENLIVSASEESNIAKLLNKKIDAVIQSQDALIYRLKGSGFSIEDFDIGYQLHKNSSTEHCMALSKSSSEFITKQVNQAFQLWQKNN